MELPNWALYLLVAFVLWTVSSWIYRLYFHPLARFPGPRLAAASFLYEMYYDLIKAGQYTWKLGDLHKQYGPVIRINPDELHFNDPDYYDEIFNVSNGNIEKPFKEANMFGPYPAAIGTIGHNLHRIRRGALSNFFSRQSVVELAPFIVEVIERLSARFDEAAKTAEPIDLQYAYAALTVDVITEYCFSKCSNRIDIPDFDKKKTDDISGFVRFSLWNAHIPWLMGWLYTLPDAITRRLNQAMADTLDFRNALGAQVESIKAGKEKLYEISGHRTIFHSLLESNLSAQDMSELRLRDEAFSIVTAGSETTAHFLKNTTYQVMANPGVRNRLLADLNAIMPNRNDLPELLQLEKLPYLQAIIFEGLRLDHAVCHRLLRSFPKKVLKYGDWEVPPGTIVSMTSVLMHTNPDIFPDPHVFRPERWLGKDSQRLQRYLTPFSRGTRACLGITLAWAEMYLTLGTIFRRFKFDVSAIDRARDIDSTRDLLIGAPSPEARGVVVRISKVVD